MHRSDTLLELVILLSINLSLPTNAHKLVFQQRVLHGPKAVQLSSHIYKVSPHSTRGCSLLTCGSVALLITSPLYVLGLMGTMPKRLITLEHSLPLTQSTIAFPSVHHRLGSISPHLSTPANTSTSPRINTARNPSFITNRPAACGNLT